MKATLEVLNALVAEGLLERYAIGGAMGAMFYAEPVATYDLDIFVVLPQLASGLITLKPLYDALCRRGHVPERECVMIEGVPVQFLPAFNPLLEEALEQAKTIDVEGVAARVLQIEHLIAIAAQTGRGKDFDRIRLLTASPQVDWDELAAIGARHGVAVPSRPDKASA